MPRPLLKSPTNSKFQNTCFPFFGAATLRSLPRHIPHPLRHFVLAFSERQGGYGDIVSHASLDERVEDMQVSQLARSVDG